MFGWLDLRNLLYRLRHDVYLMISVHCMCIWRREWELRRNGGKEKPGTILQPGRDMRYRTKFGVLTQSLTQQMRTSFKYQEADKGNLQRKQKWPPSLYEFCGKWEENWDGRHRAKRLAVGSQTSNKMDEEKYSQKVTIEGSKATRSIILIRHGQYEDMAQSDFDDLRHLTEKGRLQAYVTGRRLKELRSSGLIQFNTLISSTFRRAIETSDLIYDELKSPEIVRRTDPMLCEGAPCQPEPEPKADSWPISKRQYMEDGARIESAFRRYFYRAPSEQENDSFEVIVCHANVIRYFICRALQFPPQGWLRFSLSHASLTWISIWPDGEVSMRLCGDSGHFPPHLITHN